MSRRSRSRPIRTKIVSLLLVPLVSLLALWLFSARVTLNDTLILLDGRTLGNFAFSGEDLLVALQKERRASLMHVGAADEPADRSQMDAMRNRTDEAADTFLRHSRDRAVQGAAKPETEQWIDQAVQRLDGLDTLRSSVDDGDSGVVAILENYAAIMMPLARIPGSMSAGVGEPQIAKEANTLGAMLVAREILDQEYAMLSGALADGKLAASEYTKFVELEGTARYVYAQVVPDMRPEDRAWYQRIAATSAYDRVQAMEEQILDMGGGGSPPVEADEWQVSSTAVMDDLIILGKTSGEATIERTMPAILTIVIQLALAGILGLVAVVLSIVLSVRIGRSIVRDLRGLREAARELAEVRLPRAVERLHRGGPDEDVADDATARLPAFATQEIAQVGEAFSAVQRTAVNEAVNEARMRAGIRQIFVNLARRSQTLLSRQLKMLDGMERGTADPDALEDLFRLDHLATRMQRHAEGLLILSGSTPGRSWRDPVPMIDVLRAAVAEVEGYARVEVLPVQPRPLHLTGPAVADVVHMLAELIENATLYSPPNTEVRVQPQLVSNGFAVEIEDRGLGMSAENLAAANERLANPPEFDPTESARLGLFVVGQLAKRHEIRISLRGSPYGGITAIVLLPLRLIVDVHTGDGGGRRPEDAVSPAPVAGTGPAGSLAGSPGKRAESEPAGVAGGQPAARPGDPPTLPRRVRQASADPQQRKGPGAL